jgi:osomolarity two-component system sensor histidine kinase SLN1
VYLRAQRSGAWLTTYSKNELGQFLSLDEKEFRLRDINSQILAIFGQQAKEGEISLSFKFESFCDVGLYEEGQLSERRNMGLSELGLIEDDLLYGDEYWIVQVVLNLVLNNLKFTLAGGLVTVTVCCIGEAYMSNIRRASV